MKEYFLCDRVIVDLFSKFDQNEFEIFGYSGFLESLWGTESKVLRTIQPIRTQIESLLKTSLQFDHD